MKRYIKILFAAAVLSCFGFASAVCYAQDAEYQLLRRQYTVNRDGTIDIRFRKEIKLLRNRAITAYADKGETFILYNPTLDRLTINESYTVRKDGTRVQTPQNAFIDQLPSQCADCGRYNGLRERVVVHTALEYDCIVVLDYTINRRTALLDETVVFAEDCPVKRYELIVDAPDGTLTVSTGNEKSLKQLKDGHALHLVGKNLPQRVIENYQPDERTLYPYAHFAYGSDPYKTIEMPLEALPEADHVLGELYEKDPLTYATNIRDYVADNIHTTDFPLSLINYEVAPAKTTFLSNCGTPRDKEWLTVCMLRQAGFEAEDQQSNGHITFTVKENGSELTYMLSTHNKRPARLEGAAVDEQRTISIDRTLPWSGRDLGGGYSQMTLPTEEGSIAIDPAWLTQERQSPIKVRNCNEHYHYTITMPQATRLVQRECLCYTKKGVGSICITVRQQADGTLDVVRELNIDVADGVVSTKQYKAFRQLMQDWNSHKYITIKSVKSN